MLLGHPPVGTVLAPYSPGRREIAGVRKYRDEKFQFSTVGLIIPLL